MVEEEGTALFISQDHWQLCNQLPLIRVDCCVGVEGDVSFFGLLDVVEQGLLNHYFYL